MYALSVIVAQPVWKIDLLIIHVGYDSAYGITNETLLCNNFGLINEKINNRSTRNEGDAIYMLRGELKMLRVHIPCMDKFLELEDKRAS